MGNGNDFSAQVSGSNPLPPISSAIGSFDSVTGVERRSTLGRRIIFSLQLNTNTFNTSSCSGGACVGWQQFVFSNSSEAAFIQYWLINYGTTCPTNWNTYETTYGNDCWRNGNAVYVPVQTITNLAQLRFQRARPTRAARIQSSCRRRVAMPMQQTQDSVLNLSQGWQIAEFNIFGDCCLSQAYFTTSE